MRRRLNYDLAEMLELRSKGMSYSKLGRIYKKDRTTIMFHCRKYGIQIGISPSIRTLPIASKFNQMPVESVQIFKSKHPKLPHKYEYLFEEKTSGGKTYAEYLAESLRRPIERNYKKRIGFQVDFLATLPGLKKS